MIDMQNAAHATRIPGPDQNSTSIEIALSAMRAAMSRAIHRADAPFVVSELMPRPTRAQRLRQGGATRMKVKAISAARNTGSEEMPE